MAQKEQKKGKSKEAESPAKANTDFSHLPTPKPRLQEKYRSEVVKKLMEQFKYDNVMMVPKLKKISINIGVGQASQDPKLMEIAVKELAMISGQKPEVRKSKKSDFKLQTARKSTNRVPSNAPPRKNV